MLSGAGALAATAALAPEVMAQAPAAPAAATPQAPAKPTPPRPRVTLQTAKGAILIELATDKAPISCANFLRYVAAKRYDGASFYRAITVQADPLTGLVQCGVKNNPAKAFKPIAHESTLQTGLSNRDGAVSLARFKPGSATSEFFFCIGDDSSLDADPKKPGDNLGFAVFGQVVEGLDLVKAILQGPVSPTKGAKDGMKGQMLEPEVRVISVRRV